MTTDRLLPAVTLLGHVCIDHNTVDGARRDGWGSSSMYIANFLKNELGIQAKIITNYGQDFAPYSNGVNLVTDPVIKNTLVYENIVVAGTRVQYCHHSELSKPVDLSDDVIETLRHSNILIIAPMIANYDSGYIASIMKSVPQDCLKVLLPQGYMRNIGSGDKVEKRQFSEADEVLAYFDVVVASDEDCDNALDLAAAWVKQNGNLLAIITQSSKGATLINKNGSTHIPTSPIPLSEIRNPIGCGDVFSAQLAISLSNGVSQIEAVHEANATARKLILQDKNI